jgi:hypothetical protein
MAKRVSVDKWLFSVTLLLVFIGLIMVFSASAVMAKERFGSPYGFLLRQMAWAGAGLAAMIVIMHIDYRKYRRASVVFTFLGFTSLLLIAVFLFRDSHNTHRWIKLGGFSLQPSELAKPCVFSGVTLAANHRLEERAAAGRRSGNLVRPAHCEGARSGHRHRVPGHLRRRIVRGRDEHEISGIRIRRVTVAAVLSSGPCSLALGASAGLPRPL